MSEYQYYEWQTIDQPLNAEEQDAVNALSRHMDRVTSTQAIVTYSWSDFKHDPRKVLLKYFDAMLYLTNWGTRQLMFRFPKGAIESNAIQPYCREEILRLTLEGNYYILEFLFDEEEPDSEWMEGEGILGKLIPLREQILQGDFRALYLGWLKAASLEDPNESSSGTEPPLPPGLRTLNSSHQTFIEFFHLDHQLIKAAASASLEFQPASIALLENALSKLSREESEDFLRRFLKNEPRIRTGLQKRLGELAGLTSPGLTQGQRATEKLFKEAERLKQETLRRQKARAEQKRVQGLLELAKREDSTWHWVESLIGQKQAGPYAEATTLLISLRDLAVYQERLAQFDERIAILKNKYANRPSLMERFKHAGL
ncbi:MAG TPA: hypothetical protein VIN60_04520 [Anaerolineales bacterium]